MDAQRIRLPCRLIDIGDDRTPLPSLDRVPEDDRNEAVVELRLDVLGVKST